MSEELPDCQPFLTRVVDTKKQFISSFREPILIFLCSIALLFLSVSLSAHYHLGILGVALSQFISMCGPIVIWSKQRRSRLLLACGLSPFNATASIAGAFLGIFVSSILLCWVGPLLERICPMSQAQQEAFSLFLHPRSGFRPLWVDILCLAMIPSISEEILFRGVLFPMFLSIRIRFFQRSLLHVGTAIVLSSLLFAASHRSLAQMIPTFLLGTAFGTGVYASRSLWTSITMHAVNNAWVLLLFRFFSLEEISSLRHKILATTIGMVSLSIGLIFLRKLGPHHKGDETKHP